MAVASVLWFGERLGIVRWSALGLSLVGLVLTLTGSGGLGELDALGIGLVVPGGVGPGLLRPGRAPRLRRHPADRGGRDDDGAAPPIGYLAIARRDRAARRARRPAGFRPALLPVVLAGLIGAGIPTLCFITGIRLLGASRAAILATLEPVVGVALAAWLLGEQPAPIQLVGGALDPGGRRAPPARAAATPIADHEAVATRP